MAVPQPAGAKYPKDHEGKVMGVFCTCVLAIVLRTPSNGSCVRSMGAHRASPDDASDVPPSNASCARPVLLRLEWPHRAEHRGIAHVAPHRLELCHSLNLHDLSDEMLQRIPRLVSKWDRYPPIPLARRWVRRFRNGNIELPWVGTTLPATNSACPCTLSFCP